MRWCAFCITVMNINMFLCNWHFFLELFWVVLGPTIACLRDNWCRLLTVRMPFLLLNQDCYCWSNNTYVHNTYSISILRPSGLCPGFSRWASTRTNLDFTEARDSVWQWHHLGHMQTCSSSQIDNYASTPPLSFFTGRRQDALSATQPSPSKH